jgi:hypothetical protein
LRCYYLGLSYLQAGKSPEALALLDRAKEQIQVAKTHHDSCSAPNKDFLKKLADTDIKIRSYKSEAHAKSFLQSIEEKKQKESPRGVRTFILLSKCFQEIQNHQLSIGQLRQL